MELLANVCVVILLVYGGSLVIREELTLGELVQFFSMVWYIIGPMWGLGFHINNYTQSKASGERVLEILNQHIHVKDSEDAIELDPSTGARACAVQERHVQLSGQERRRSTI